VTLKAQQACTTQGQTPATAFPVCGRSAFIQSSVPACYNNLVPVACPADGNVYKDLNPYWYKFTCFVSGTLGLTITPKDLNDDYDWELFDITGHNPADVYSNASLSIGYNWSGLHGVTGTSSNASSLKECGSLGNSNPPIFSKMPQLVKGHKYLLLVSHFLGSDQSGYSLSFTGGTASITDTVPPVLKEARASCDGTKILVLLNKKMKCGSLAANGSDFGLSPASASITGASGNSCNSGFDMDSVVLTLSGALPVGKYTVTSLKGSDNNTLLDNCDAEVPAGTSLLITIVPIQPTPMDSLTTPGCAPGLLQLVFSRPIRCNSIAGDGSDFIVSGNSAISVTGASGNCDVNGESNIILVKLSAPILSQGTYQIKLAAGSDGNTIIDDCGQETPAGASLLFSTKDTVSAAFTYQILQDCKKDTILFKYDEKNGVNQWQWIFDNTDTILVKDPIHTYSVFGEKKVQLIVSNGICSDTAKSTIPLDNALKADFEAPNLLCPKDPAVFKNNSIGHIRSWNWDLGDGTGSTFSLPSDHLYPLMGMEKKYTVSLIVGNDLGCRDTAIHQIDVLKTCYIAVPSAFTPNGDGLNDYLYPLNANKADNLEFRVYNRFGQLVFETKDWTRKWDGRIGGQQASAGTYVWTLQYTDRDLGKKFFLKGTSVLIR
jgi:gliding motility-associated-like protein